jgi:hypothetical protein
VDGVSGSSASGFRCTNATWLPTCRRRKGMRPA